MQYNIRYYEHAWNITGPNEGEPESIEVEYSTTYSVGLGGAPYTNRRAIESFTAFLKETDPPWLHPGPKEWVLDLDVLRKTFSQLSSLNWLRGKIPVELRVETQEDQSSRYAQTVIERMSGVPEDPFTTTHTYESKVYFVVSREAVENLADVLGAPIELRESLKRFRVDFPDHDKTSFLIMHFGTTPAHKQIVEAVKTTLESHGIRAIRADERQYHDDLFDHISTLMHGCSFGIAVFERMEQETPNPNVLFEAGYMMALGKPVSRLKDKTIKILPADLVGKLSCPFDPHNPVASISSELDEWLRKKGLGLNSRANQQ